MAPRIGATICSLALVGVGLLSGCGGGSGSSAEGSEAQARTGTRSATVTARHRHAPGAAGFEVAGADNSIQRSGTEASAAEKGAAAGALHAYLAGRAAGEWAAACRRLAPPVIASLRQMTGGRKLGCAKTIAALSGSLPAAARKEAAIAHVGALRLQGSGGFILFRGAHDAAYFMPMARQGGRWLVAAIAPSSLE